MTDPHSPSSGFGGQIDSQAEQVSQDASGRVDEPHIPPLADGEERLLQTVRRADGNRNEIYLVHRRPSDDAFTGAGEPINFVAVIRYPDEDSGDTSVPSAWQRGPSERSIYIAIAEAFANVGVLPGSSVSNHPDVLWFVDRINEKYGSAPSPTQTAANWTQVYVAACGEVLSAANACLEVANRAVGARRQAAERPQHEISIQNFTRYAEEAERNFPAVYRTFDEACVTARDAAVQLLGAQPDPLFAEMLLASTVEEQLVDNVAMAKGILGASFGPTPAAFLQGVEEANALMQNPPDEGNIYRPRGPAPASGIVLPDAARRVHIFGVWLMLPMCIGG